MHAEGRAGYIRDDDIDYRRYARDDGLFSDKPKADMIRSKVRGLFAEATAFVAFYDSRRSTVLPRTILYQSPKAWLISRSYLQQAWLYS